MIGKILMSAVFGFMALAVSAQSFAQDAEIAERIKLMKSNSAAAKAIKSAVSKNDYATVASKAREIANSMEMKSFARLFPQNSTSSKSRARADIWAKWKDFMADANDAHQKALALAAAADAKDGAKVSAAKSDLDRACGSCHKPFRGPRKK